MGHKMCNLTHWMVLSYGILILKNNKRGGTGTVAFTGDKGTLKDLLYTLLEFYAAAPTHWLVWKEACTESLIIYGSVWPDH